MLKEERERGRKQIKTVTSLLLHPTPHWREGLYVSDLGEARNSLSSVWHDITSDMGWITCFFSCSISKCGILKSWVISFNTVKVHCMTQFRNYANLGVEKKHIRNYERGNLRGGGKIATNVEILFKGQQSIWFSISKSSRGRHVMWRGEKERGMGFISLSSCLWAWHVMWLREFFWEDHGITGDQQQYRTHTCACPQDYSTNTSIG